MEFRNFTPFPALAYQALDQHDTLYHAVACRQTMTIQLDGVLEYSDKQDELVVADEYFGEMNASSVKQESDLAPFKPKCDVIVIATAFSPNGKSCPSFQVRIRIVDPNDRQRSSYGEQLPDRLRTVLDKTLTITGPRYWTKQSVLAGWKLTAPESVTSLPVQYEYAYGGELRISDPEQQQVAIEHGENNVCPENPIGRGYVDERFIRRTKANRIPAPQIEDPANPVANFGVPYPVQGLGVIAKAWRPRRDLAHTEDEAFLKSTKWLPDDFDFAYWNGAHSDLQVPYLQGVESIELTNLTPRGKLVMQLPGHRPYALLRYEDGEITPTLLNLDSLIVNTSEMKLSLVHRLTLPNEKEVRVLELRVITKDEWDSALQQQPASRHTERSENHSATDRAVHTTALELKSGR